MDSVTASGTAATKAAAEAAAAAAERSGVTIRLLADLADLEATTALIDGIWRPDTGSLVSVELLRALSHAGNYVAGAFEGSTMLGACVGFLAAPAGATLHSHIAGVSAAARSRSVGFALKLHQRAWAMEHGLTTITWTADPLVRRNAYFNVVKLGALPVDYLADFYGDIGDAVNGGQGTDRLLFRWELAAPAVADTCAGRRHEPDLAEWRATGGVTALAESTSGRPDVTDTPGTPARRARIVLVQIPADIEALRHEDARLAKDWRHAVRDVLGGLLAEGGRVVGLTRSGWYAVERGAS